MPVSLTTAFLKTEVDGSAWRFFLHGSQPRRPPKRTNRTPKTKQRSKSKPRKQQQTKQKRNKSQGEQKGAKWKRRPPGPQTTRRRKNLLSFPSPRTGPGTGPCTRRRVTTPQKSTDATVGRGRTLMRRVSK